MDRERSTPTDRARTIGALPGRSSETPYWDDMRGRLVWAEIRRESSLGGAVHSWDPASGDSTTTHFEQSVGGVAPRVGGGIVLALGTSVATLSPSSGLEIVTELDDRDATVRLNDAGCDPDGAFWTGTMPHETGGLSGSLYRVDGGGHVTEMLRDVRLTNGFGWSPDGERMYFVDSLAECVAILASWRRPQEASGITRLIEIANDAAAPFGMTVADGMTVDAEGAIWVAIFGTGEVHRYTPDGELDRIVEVPHLAPTSCTFGGPELEDLFVTSGAEGPEHVFHCRPGTSGLPAARFAG